MLSGYLKRRGSLKILSPSLKALVVGSRGGGHKSECWHRGLRKDLPRVRKKNLFLLRSRFLLKSYPGAFLCLPWPTKEQQSKFLAHFSPTLRKCHMLVPWELPSPVFIIDFSSSSCSFAPFLPHCFVLAFVCGMCVCFPRQSLPPF